MVTGKAIRMPLDEKCRFILAMLFSRSQRRHIFRWLNSLHTAHLLEAGIPWITYDATAYMEKRLHRGIKVFEYGSGGSTVYWLRAGALCVSTEHDARWFELVRKHLGEREGLNYHLVPPERDPYPKTPADPADPEGYVSGDVHFKGMCFRRYASWIDVFPDGYFDIVLIDGRARPSCIKHGAPKVKLGGVLILDNADILYYTQKSRGFLANYTLSTFQGVGPSGKSMWRTDIFERRK